MNLPYTAECASAIDDRIEVTDPDGGGEVVLVAAPEAGKYFTVCLSPKKARRLAKAIKKAAKRAEGARR